ncbi:MAG: UTP--glucose-1-phosphate uridylyltransferase GalU [Candidatus Hydrogenedentota bacterium]
MTRIKGVFPAAGLGTRFLPATKNQPKEMLPIYDKPAIQYVIEEAVAAGIEDILVIIGRGKRTLADHFDRHPELEAFLESKNKPELIAMIRNISEMANIHYIRQKDALGLGHAVLTAESFVSNQPFAVFLADDIVHPDNGGKNAIAQMLEIHEETGCSVIGLEAVPDEKVPGYGVIAGNRIREGLYELTGVVEKPPIEKAPSNLTIVGRYIFTPAIMQHLHETPPGRNGEIQLTDAVSTLLKKEKVYGLTLKGRRYDTGDPAGFLEATIEYALRSPHADQVRQYLRTLTAKL